MILNIDRKRQYMTSNEDGLISIAPLYKRRRLWYKLRILHKRML